MNRLNFYSSLFVDFLFLFLYTNMVRKVKKVRRTHLFYKKCKNNTKKQAKINFFIKNFTKRSKNE